MAIGIIGAMEKEVAEIKKNIQYEKIEKKAGLEFFKGVYCGKEIIAVKCGIGKVNAAICTQILIDDFKVDAVINTGIAGGIRSGIKTGDVVISTDLVYHDVDTTVFGDRFGQVPNMDVFNFVADENLVNKAIESAKEEVNFSIYSGRIVSGDQFVASKERIDFIKTEFEASAVEMEGAAIAHVCHVNKVPFVIIRSISDGADDNAQMDYEKFQNIAIENSISIINNMLNKM